MFKEQLAEYIVENLKFLEGWQQNELIEDINKLQVEAGAKSAVQPVVIWHKNCECKSFSSEPKPRYEGIEYTGTEIIFDLKNDMIGPICKKCGTEWVSK